MIDVQASGKATRHSHTNFLPRGPGREAGPSLSPEEPRGSEGCATPPGAAAREEAHRDPVGARARGAPKQRPLGKGWHPLSRVPQLRRRGSGLWAK